jgi:hypothetical protein
LIKKFFQIFRKKRIIIALVFAVLISILGLTTPETQVSKIQSISEEAVFDPLCLADEGETFEGKLFCDTWSWIVPMGGSANVFHGDKNDNHARVQFLMVDISEIPKSNFFTTTIISKSELVLKVRYEPALTNSTEEIPFYLMTKFCDKVDWTSNTSAKDLPCINKNKFPIGNYSSFEPINPKWIEDVRLDLKPHFKLANEKNLNSFTELIQFYPVEMSLNNGYTDETRICVEEKMDDYFTYSDFNDCLSKYRISVYANTNPNEGARPHILLEYSTKPTLFTQALIAASVAGIPIVSTVLQLQYKSKEEQKSKMTRICDSLIKEIEDTSDGLKNGVDGKELPREIVYVDFHKDYEPLKITLSKPISDLILFTEAYKGIVNSGSLENFDKDNQIAITKLYNEIFEYNKTLELFYRLVEDARVQIIPEDHMSNFISGLNTNCEIYLIYLAKLRFSIIHSIDDTKGVLDILQKEKELKF